MEETIINKKPSYKKLTCIRCNGQWWPIKPHLPKKCACCKSPYWNKPYKNKVKNKKP